MFYNSVFQIIWVYVKLLCSLWLLKVKSVIANHLDLNILCQISLSTFFLNALSFEFAENRPISISSDSSYFGVESRNSYDVERASSIKNSNVSHDTQLLTCARLERSLSVSETPSTSTTDTYSLKMRINSCTSGSSSGLSKSSHNKKSTTHNSLRESVHFTEGPPVVVLEDNQDPFAFDEDDSGLSKSSYCQKSMTLNSSRKNVQFTEGTPVVILEDSQDPFAFDQDDSGLWKSSDCQKSLNSSRKNVHFTERTPAVILEDNHDPFAFDEDDIVPSQWDLLSGKHKPSHSKKHKVANRKFENERQSQTKMSQENEHESQTKLSQENELSQTKLSQENERQLQTKMSQQESSDGNVNCSNSDISYEEDSSLLSDCLLTAVKVFYWI